MPPIQGVGARARVGRPRLRVFDPLVSEVMQACSFCGKRCYIALNGRTLLDPDYKRERKAKSPHDRVTHEAERHEYTCRGMR